MSTGPTLHEAARERDIQLLEWLLDQGGDPNGVDESGHSVLVAALDPTEIPGVDVVRLLLDRGADPNLADPWGNTPMHNLPNGCRSLRRGLTSVGEEIAELAELLLAYGADINARNVADCTPLDLAALGYIHAAAEWLLSHGAECSFGTMCRLDLVDEVRAAIGEGASVTEDDGSGTQPIHEAAAGLAAAAVELLLSLGAPVNAATIYGVTPLHLAANARPRRTQLQVVEMLLGYGADPDAEDEEGRTPVDMAMAFACIPHDVPPLWREVCHLLISRGANRWGIHAASAFGEADRVRGLLDAGTSPDVPGEFQMTPLFYAVSEHRQDVVETLLARGASPDARAYPDRSTPLHLAAKGGDAAAAAALIGCGADVNALDVLFRTPLAVAGTATDVHDLLRRHGGLTFEEDLDLRLGGSDADECETEST